MSEQQANGSNGITVEEIWLALDALAWREGLTRDQIRRKWRKLPQSVYLRLPASRRYHSADAVLRDAGIAASRAEGEFLGAAPDVPETESLDEGGPPAWGPSPLFTPGAAVDGGSAEDRTLAEGGD